MATRKKKVDGSSELQPDLNNSENGIVKEPKKRKPVMSNPGRKPDQANDDHVKPEISKKEIDKVIHDPISSNSIESIQNDRGPLFLGGGLLLVGVILFIGNILQISFGDYLWPFIFIVPGLMVFLSALSTDRNSGEGLSILGAILLSLGLIFFLQAVTGLWATWAYIWALIAPTSIGLAQMVYGERKGRSTIVESGKRLAKIGVILFAVGFIFFELIIGISGFGLRELGLPVIPSIFIFAGIIVLARALTQKK